MTITAARKALVAAAIFAAVAGGCAHPTTADLDYARSAREGIAATLSGFAQAVRDKDALAAAAFISPEVAAARRADMEHVIKRSVCLEVYTGYGLDVERAVDGLSWRVLRNGAVELKVRATNAAGWRFKDRFALARSGDRWLIADVSLQEPYEYERVDPPPREAEAIKALLGQMFLSLQNKRPGEVFYMLPKDEGTRYRPGRRSFWAKLFGGEPRYHSVYRDLQMMCEFSVLRWPDPTTDLRLGFISLDMLVACYDIPYLWLQAGVSKPTNLRMEVFLRRDEEKWRVFMLRLYGEGIPE